MAVIAGNWKMHMTPRETEAFFTALDLTEVVAHNEFIIFLLGCCRSVRGPRPEDPTGHPEHALGGTGRVYGGDIGTDRG